LLILCYFNYRNEACICMWSTAETNLYPSTWCRSTSLLTSPIYRRNWNWN